MTQQSTSHAVLYKGSVKDVLGPVYLDQIPALIFEYTDAYSVFDWGKMPDGLPKKGEALAILSAEIFEKIEKPETWREFSRTPEALALRKGNRFGALFNEMGEVFQQEGMRTHYLGVFENPKDNTQSYQWHRSVSEVQDPFRHILVRQVSVAKPTLSSVLGRTLADYQASRQAPAPRLIPLEVVFRMSCPEGSSLLQRTEGNPDYMASLGFPHVKVGPDSHWDFPVLELFTKLESTDRPLSLSEALAISGLSGDQLQSVLLKTAWVAGLLRSWFAKLGVELADGKLEWAVTEKGECILVDAIGPDELRLLKNGVQLSKEFLRTYYRKTKWYQTLQQAKKVAMEQGSSEWKKWVAEGPPALPPSYRDLAVQIYQALANGISAKKWFPDVDSLDVLVGKIQDSQGGSQ